MLKNIPMIIAEILTKNAEKYGNEIALIEREPEANKRSKMTWKQFDADANRLANVLFS